MIDLKGKTRIIISGGRDYEDIERMVKVLDLFLGQIDIEKLLLLFGDCKTGADKLVLEYAEKREIDYAKYDADWEEHGASAGPIRNGRMAKDGHALVAFWNMQSPGTANMIELARNHKLPTMIIVY